MSISITLFGKGKQSFLDILDEHGISYQRKSPPVHQPRHGMAFNTTMPEMIEVFSSLASATPYGALAAGVYAWLSRNKRNKYQVTLKDGKVIEIITEGYSVEEVESLLKITQSTTAIAPDKD